MAITCTVPRWWLEEVERLLADHGEYRLRTEAQAALRSSGPGGSRADEMLSEEAFERIAASRAKNGRGRYLGADGEMHDDDSEVGGAVMERGLIPNE